MHENIADIPTVKSWAKKAGVSREWLYKNVKKTYDISPKVILREIKFRKIMELIKKEGVEAAMYGVAVEAGLRDASSLSKFLSSHYDTSFTQLKAKCLKNGNIQRSKYSN